jgi:uncharacterized protein (DUF58 family)
MDFDDLREYAPGDDVRDIDWNATARSATTLIRRYHAERKQTVTFVVDLGRSMAATAASSETKRDILVAAVGTIAYLSTKHGDDVGMISGHLGQIQRLPTGHSDAHLERLLRVIDSGATVGSPQGDLQSLLEFAGRTITRRSILVLVSDERPLSESTADTLRQLRSRHELLWISVGDSALGRVRTSRAAVLDVSEGSVLPDAVVRNRGVLAEAQRSRRREQLRRAELLQRAGVAQATIQSVDDVVPQLILLLGKRGYARG